MSTSNVSFLARLLVGWVSVGLVAGCAPTLLPLGIDIGKIPGKISSKNEPISAALVIPEKVKNATSTLDVRCGGTYTVPVGIELMEGMLHGLSQVFDSVSLVDAKPAQSGEYDFVIEPALPELTVDGKNCYIRRGLWVVFPVKLFYNPVDKFEAQTTLRVSVEDRTGKIIMNKTFSSQWHNRDNDNSSADVVPIAGALQSSFCRCDPADDFGRGRNRAIPCLCSKGEEIARSITACGSGSS